MPLTEKQCVESDYLRTYFNEGCVEAISYASHDISKGVYFKENVPGMLENPSTVLSIEEFARKKGFQVTYNNLTNAVINGWIRYENTQKKENKKVD